ncbi:MAG: DEAD/DEAH box helicase family protein [Bacillota bacterium]
MRRFPDDISFIPPWRRYQRRVLENLDRHLENRHLHLVAPPGSGKTVLGLEVMLRVNKPTIILAPTLTIKEQWLQRFLELFLKANEKPEWISTHIKQPAFVTITADQALHSLFEKETEEAEVFKMEAGKPCRAPWKRASSAKKKGTHRVWTIILDEAHSLSDFSAQSFHNKWVFRKSSCFFDTWLNVSPK